MKVAFSDRTDIFTVHFVGKRTRARVVKHNVDSLDIGRKNVLEVGHPMDPCTHNCNRLAVISEGVKDREEDLTHGITSVLEVLIVSGAQHESHVGSLRILGIHATRLGGDEFTNNNRFVIKGGSGGFDSGGGSLEEVFIDVSAFMKDWTGLPGGHVVCLGGILGGRSIFVTGPDGVRIVLSKVMLVLANHIGRKVKQSNLVLVIKAFLPAEKTA